MSTTATMSGAGTASGNGTAASATAGAPLVLAGGESGLTLIPQPTALTRLNYFDGKFLRADDLRLEQDYLRNLVWLSNRAGGSGVVFGLDVDAAAGGTLSLSAGLAIDPRGRVLSLPYDATVDLAKLVEASRRASSASGSATGAAGAPGFGGCAADAVATPPSGGAVTPTDLYLVVALHAEALCGQQDVYGKLCEDACVTSTDRPYRLEGIVLRAIPLPLGGASCTASWLTRKHRRSQVASAYFADERARLGREMSAARLRTEVWCHGAAAETGDGVPLAVVSLNGGTLEFVDEWTARRERLTDPALRWWQWQTAMRPLAVFWAQVLQFQCQLADVVVDNPRPGGDSDPCSRQYSLLRKTQEMLAQVERQYRELAARSGDGKKHGEGTADDSYEIDLLRPDFVAQVADLQADVKATLTQLDDTAATRVLIDAGITELPPAGWLPVAPGPVDVNTQVRRLLGDGVDLRFCSVRADYVAHAFEEAQHLDRICLLKGLEDPNALEEVDVLVPEGTVVGAEKPAGLPLEAKFLVELFDTDHETLEVTGGDVLLLSGAARGELPAAGGAAFHFAGQGLLAEKKHSQQPTNNAATFVEGQRQQEVTPEPLPAAPASFTARVSGDTAFQAETPAAAEGLTMARIKRVFAARPQSGGAKGGVVGHQQAPPPANPPTSGNPPTPGSSSGDDTPFSPSVWATVRIDGNPFVLRPGDGTGVRGDFAMSFEDKDANGNKSTGVVELHLQGDLTCDTGGDGQPSLTGRAAGFAVFSVPGKASESTFINAPVEMALTATAGGGAAFALKIVGPDHTHLSLAAQWSPRPVLAKATVTEDWIQTALGRLVEDAKGDASKIAQAKERIAKLVRDHPEYDKVPLAGASLRESADSAKPGNAYHDASVQALAVLETLVGRPGFRQAAEAKLFPSAQVSTDPRRILATRDWVLFHRRRRSSCDCQCHPEPAAAARRYRVYHFRVPSDWNGDEVHNLVTGGVDIPGLQTVGVVPQFLAGGATLATPRATILDAWKQVTPGASIVYGAVVGAGDGAGDPAAVQDARLEAVSSVVDDLTPDAQAFYEVLQAIPPALAAGGVDGLIVLATRDENTTVCHQAYRLRRGISLADLDKAVKAGRLPGDLDKVAKSIGSYGFQEGTATPVGDVSGIRAAWVALGDGEPGDGATYSSAAAGSALQKSQVDQANVLAKALDAPGADAADPVTIPVSPACDVVTFFPMQATARVCQEVWRVDDQPVPGAAVTIYEVVLQRVVQGQIDDALSLPGVTKLTDLGFDEGNAEYTGDPSDVTGAWTGGSIDVVATFSVGPQVPGEGVALYESRSETIAKLLPDAANAQFESFAGQADISCSAITVLVHKAPVTSDTVCQEAYALRSGARQRVFDLIQAGKLDDPVLPQLAPRIATVQFEAGKPDTLLGSGATELKKGWEKEMGNGLVVNEVFSVFVGALPGDKPPQSAAIAKALGFTQGVNVTSTPGPLPGSCPAVTFLVASD